MTLGFLAIAFIAGVLTVLAPCILPLLPIIVGGSVTGEQNLRRVAVITVALGASVFFFTLLLKATTALITIPELFWQLFSGGLLLLFGFVTLFPGLWDRLPGVSSVYRQSNLLLGSGYQRQNIWGDIIVGAALGPVFSSCSPTYFVILAAVLPAHFAAGVVYLLAYVFGLSAFLFVVAALGQRAALWLGLAADSRGWLKKSVGILFIVVGVGIIFGIDKRIEAALPQGAFGEIGLEQQLLASQSPTASSTVQSSPASNTFLSQAEKSRQYQKAPELAGIAGYINTDGQPVSLAHYVGKNVVLVDFWDYSCINCQRTTPYLNAWYQKYRDQSLVIVGVHTPEFAFEQQQANVQAAVTQAGIKYPVVLDNQYKTWAAFQNSYWPNEYLIDIDGYVVHTHAGEGEYDQTEAAIQAALKERAARLHTNMVATSTVTIKTQDLDGIGSPETYFGSNRNEYLANGTPGISGAHTFTLPSASQVRGNALYLGGNWNIMPEYAEAAAGAKIEYEYSAHDVYLVAANSGSAVTIKILRDGQPLGNFAGADVDPKTSEATISGDRLYTLVHDETPGIHTITIEIESGTLDAYTFTFG